MHLALQGQIFHRGTAPGGVLNSNRSPHRRPSVSAGVKRLDVGFCLTETTG